MKSLVGWFTVGFLLLVQPTYAQQEQVSKTFATGKNGAIATGSSDAAEAGLKVLKAPGDIS